MKINILKSIIIFILCISFFAFAKIKYVSVEEIREMAIKENIQTSRQYHERRKKNPNFNGKRIPADPKSFYKNWPGWGDVVVKPEYASIEEIREMAIKENIQTSRQYHERRRKNPNFNGKTLPALPNVFYENWPGWGNVLPRRHMTLEELKEFILTENIQTSVQYLERRKKNRTFKGKRIPANPHTFYKNWPGWGEALGNKIEYVSLEEIREMAIKENIQTSVQYLERRKKNDTFNGKRLPAHPETFYPEWTSWNDVLVEKESKHISLEEIKEMAKKENIKTSTQYQERRKKDPIFNGKIIPSNPDVFYENWPGWAEALGNKIEYVSLEEIREMAEKEGIKTGVQYQERRKKNRTFNGKRLPALPSVFYENWPGWGEALGNKVEYVSLEEIREMAEKENIRTGAQYQERREKNDTFNGKKLPANPYIFYKNWPGWGEALGKNKCKKVFNSSVRAS